LLATWGTAKAAAEMSKSLGGDICGLGFAIELDGLKGRDKLKDYDVFSLLHYDI
jgi:adenine phosphoribosyltransferase